MTGYTIGRILLGAVCLKNTGQQSKPIIEEVRSTASSARVSETVKNKNKVC